VKTICGHEFKKIKGIEIDVEMIPIIRFCWKNKIKTKYCCGGDPKIHKSGYISFLTSEDRDLFLSYFNIISVSELNWAQQQISCENGLILTKDISSYAIRFLNADIKHVENVLGIKTIKRTHYVQRKF
jgi:hypothetical protein